MQQIKIVLLLLLLLHLLWGILALNTKLVRSSIRRPKANPVTIVQRTSINPFSTQIAVKTEGIRNISPMIRPWRNQLIFQALIPIAKPITAVPVIIARIPDHGTGPLRPHKSQEMTPNTSPQKVAIPTLLPLAIYSHLLS